MIAIFDVHGIPGPQGSKRHVGGGTMVESSKKVKPWRSDVRDAAEKWRAENGNPPLADGPLQVTFVFRLPRPPSIPKKVRRPFRKPDVSKLARSTEDALTGLLWTDDARIVDLCLHKTYCAPDDLPGCTINVFPARDDI